MKYSYIDLLALYIGNEVKTPKGHEYISSVSSIQTKSGKQIKTISPPRKSQRSWSQPDIKLILRPIDTLTFDEAKIAYKLIYNKDCPKEIYTDLWGHIVNILEDETTPKLWLWSIKKGFDIFKLIPKGIAMDQTQQKIITHHVKT